MDWDEAQAKGKTDLTIGENLSRLSIAELEARIGALEVEIARIRREVAAKKAHTAAASAMFKS